MHCCDEEGLHAIVREVHTLIDQLVKHGGGNFMLSSRGSGRVEGCLGVLVVANVVLTVIISGGQKHVGLRHICCGCGSEHGNGGESQ